MPGLRALVLMFAAVAVTACGGTDSPSDSPSPASISSATAGVFNSKFYHYTLNSPDWTGYSATTAWDGTGSPGDGDPWVDTLAQSQGQRVFAYGEPTSTTLERFVAKSRAVGARARPDCAKPEATRATTIDHEPAIVDEIHCPAKTGVFALSAYVVHDGRVYVIFTYDQPGDEAGMRAWFGDLLKKIDLN